MKILITWVILVVVSLPATLDWYTDIEKAKGAATELDRKIILVFQGSDWCGPCIKLSKEVWDTNEFEDYANNNFIMLQADFPKRKKNALPDEQQQKNNQLAEQYNPNGYFPFVVVLDSDGNVLGETGYEKNLPPILSICWNHSKPYELKFLAIPIFLLLSFDLKAQEIFKRTDLLMGSRFDITVVAGDSIEANKNIDLAIHEISRIENVISSWDTSSQTSLINRNAGIEAVHVDSELFDLIERSIQISRITSGSFDISFASMDRIWRFDGTMESLPNENEVSESIRFVGYQNIELDRESQSVYLPKTGIKIGFGAIGKGYAADKAKEKLVEAGVESGIINASGDMTVWGNQPNGEAWKVAITNPFNKTEAYALLPIYDQAIVTSGSYEKFVEINDKRYSHIIDPRTGYPATGLISVTVFAPKAELADALATSVFVMGKDIGLDLINQLIDIECIIVDENGEVYHSTNIEINTQ